MTISVVFLPLFLHNCSEGVLVYVQLEQLHFYFIGSDTVKKNKDRMGANWFRKEKYDAER